MKKLFLIISLLVFLFSLPLTIQANDTIEIPDQNLRTAILNQMGKGNSGEITKEEAQKVDSLYLLNKEISNLEGVQYFTNLIELVLSENEITDLTPLIPLQHLEELVLNDNKIIDVTPLKQIPSIVFLNLDNNRIADVSPLAALTQIGALYIGGNYIKDISSLKSLKNLEQFFYSNNYISDLSSIDNMSQLTCGATEDEDITLPAQTVKKGQNVTIINPIKDRDGIVKNLMIKNGYYNLETNEVTWENITESQTLTYTFSKQIEMKPYGTILFSGKVSVPVIVESDEIPMNQVPIIHAQNRVIEKGSNFNPLENVTANDTEDGNLTSKIKITYDNVDANVSGSYEITYEVSDESGATSTLTIKVEVREIPQTGRTLYNLK